MSAFLAAVRNPLVAFQGAREFRSGIGMTYGDNRDDAYDLGREAAHVLTFRRWDNI